MDEFLRHEPCPRCGSSDNLGRYRDGHGYCFGCGYVERVRPIPQFLGAVNKNNPEARFRLPDDAQKQIGVKGWEWLTKYGIHPSETRNWLWSESKQWLIFPIESNDGIISVWQARNFNPDRPKPKALTFGPVLDVLNIHGSGEPCVVVEDILSAVKVGRVCSAIPVYGSNVALKTLVRLSTQFGHLALWLDRDMAAKSLRTAQRAKQLGFERVWSIITERDPKEHTESEIRDLIKL